MPEHAQPSVRLVTSRAASDLTPPTAARLVPLSPDRCAVFFDQDVAPDTVGQRLKLLIGDDTETSPLMLTRLACGARGQRLVVLLHHNGPDLCRRGVQITDDHAVLARIDPFALQSPLVDPLALLTGLAPEGQIRLLRALLTTGPSLFKLAAGQGGVLDGFEAIIAQLLASLSAVKLPVKNYRALGKTARLLSYDLPAGSARPKVDELVLVSQGRVRRLSDFDVFIDTKEARTAVHLLLPHLPETDAVLVGVSDSPIHLEGPSADQDLRPLQPWLDDQSPDLKRQVSARLDPLRATDRLAGFLHRELQCPKADHPRLDVAYAGRCGDGVLYALRARDPRGLLSAVQWVHQGHRVDVSLDRPVWHPRLGDLHIGFARGFDGLGEQEATLELWGVMNSRRAFRVTSLNLAPFDGRIPAIFAPLESDPVDAALGAALAAALPLRHAPTRALEWFGKRPGAPKAMLSVFVDEVFDYPRVLLTLLAQEPGADECEVLLVGTAPGQRPGLRALAQDMNAITGLPIGALTFEAGTLSSERLRAALSLSRAEVFLLFHRDCLPEQAGWYHRWSAPMRAAVTPQILAVPVAGSAPAAPPEGAAPDHWTADTCAVLSRAAVQACGAAPLAATSLEAELSRLARRIPVEISPQDTVICYAAPLSQDMIGARADHYAITHSGTDPI